MVLSYLYLTLIAIEEIEMALFPREYIDTLKYDHTELTQHRFDYIWNGVIKTGLIIGVSSTVLFCSLVSVSGCVGKETVWDSVTCWRHQSQEYCIYCVGGSF